MSKDWQFSKWIKNKKRKHNNTNLGINNWSTPKKVIN